MSKGALQPQQFLGNYSNFDLPPMAYTNTFMPPKPNYQPLMKMQPSESIRQNFMSIQQPMLPMQPVQQPIQPTPQLPQTEPMIATMQTLATTPQSLAQTPSLLDVPDRIEKPRDRFMSIDRRSNLPPINLFR